MRFAGSVAVTVAAMVVPDAHVQAQQPLVSDRPGFTEATSTVGRGIAQIEFGYTFGLDRSNGARVHAHSLGEPLLRLGLLADWLELRVAVPPVAQRMPLDGSSSTESGLDDLYLGAKLALSEQNGGFPALAILPQATVPTGSEAFSSDEVLPGVNVLYGWDLSDAVSLTGSTQVNRVVGVSGNAMAEWAQSVSWGRALGARHGLYAEWFATFQEDSELRQAEHYFNTGLAWHITDNLQWDVRVGFGLNDDTEDFFLGTGLSVRIR